MPTKHATKYITKSKKTKKNLKFFLQNIKRIKVTM